MDNVAFLNCAEIRDKIVGRGHFIKDLQSYSSFLNPTENIFSQWKQSVRKSNPNNQDDLFNCMDSTLEEL